MFSLRGFSIIFFRGIVRVSPVFHLSLALRQTKHGSMIY
jgi:hypothetical protein